MDLLGLLKWRSNTSLLQQNLRQLMKVEGGEVVKVSGGGGGRGSVALIAYNFEYVSEIKQQL